MRIKAENFGPISCADIALGDLTILVGAQASGKSLFLELLKLMIDKDAIVKNLRNYSYFIQKSDQDVFLDAYFGYGMSKIWGENTVVTMNGRDAIKKIAIPQYISEGKEETVFYIPAQRILSISDGRPKTFAEFDPTTPYTLRQFSEVIKRFMDGGFGERNSTIFPIKTRLKDFQRDSFDKSIFHGGKVEMGIQSGQRKMRLKVNGMDMPFMTWSAGQKEFMPLLMGFYCLSGPPTRVIDKEKFQYVIIEEPEMGLHPQAIRAVLVQIIELIQSGYKVILSTHSTIPLELAWAFNNIKTISKKGREKVFARLLTGIDCSVNFKGIFCKDIRTYYFAHKENGVQSIDISTLDVNDVNSDISDWGGLSLFASEATDLISDFLHG